MTEHDGTDTETPKRSWRRFGYGVAVVVNLVLLFVVNNLLEWGWPPFLTDEFEQLLPIVGFSLVVGAVVNAAFILYDAQWFKSAGQIIENVVSLFVIVATLKTFPFDFSPYRINWATITRVALILLVIAVTIGTIAEIVKMIRALVPESGSGSDGR